MSAPASEVRHGLSEQELWSRLAGQRDKRGNLAADREGAGLVVHRDEQPPDVRRVGDGHLETAGHDPDHAEQRAPAGRCVGHVNPLRDEQRGQPH